MQNTQESNAAAGRTAVFIRSPADNAGCFRGGGESANGWSGEWRTIIPAYWGGKLVRRDMIEGRGHDSLFVPANERGRDSSPRLVQGKRADLAGDARSQRFVARSSHRRNRKGDWALVLGNMPIRPCMERPPVIFDRRPSMSKMVDISTHLEVRHQVARLGRRYHDLRPYGRNPARGGL
jgi:hypothetical protein